MIEITKMTAEEYAAFYKASYEHHVRELISEEKLSPEEAEAEAYRELAEMLPNGPDTAENCLMSLKIKASHWVIGYIWFLFEVIDEVKQSFICDFKIEKAYRRNGYGTQALLLAERMAKDHGCRKSVLFVTNANRSAEAVCQKCGYYDLKPHGYGKYMAKTL